MRPEGGAKACPYSRSHSVDITSLVQRAQLEVSKDIKELKRVSERLQEVVGFPQGDLRTLEYHQVVAERDKLRESQRQLLEELARASGTAQSQGSPRQEELRGALDREKAMHFKIPEELHKVRHQQLLLM